MPVQRMGRLATVAEMRGQGMGRLLIGGAVVRCLNASEQVAACTLIVDTKDAHVQGFYEHYGLTAFADQLLTMCLPLRGAYDG